MQDAEKNSRQEQLAAGGSLVFRQQAERNPQSG